MAYFLDMFHALHSFARHGMLDEHGIKVIIEVDGEVETERFAKRIADENFMALSLRNQPSPPLVTRNGTAMGIPFVIRTSPRCAKCHK